MKVLGNAMPWSLATDVRPVMTGDFARDDVLAAVTTRLRALETADDFSYGLLVLVGEQTREEIEDAATTAILQRERKAGRIVHQGAGRWSAVLVEA